ncbi:acetoacetate decarboxylase family protein [Nocardioides aestuarii]|uniref:Acetoacetate decarboxylase family protein n=1 Tax=Nocardioides aestuarii TaxID=252231 RepID=A0ABW4TTI6_9ACTN
MTSRVDDAVAYPASPWPLSGSLWLTVFRVGSAPAGRTAGIHGAAFVAYEDPSPLTYGELLVARPLRSPHGRRVTITDIWVDSPASVAGGRELWAIPKQLAEVDREAAYDGPVGTTAWSARVDGRPVASARFRDLSPRPPRLPFRAGLWHPGLPDTGGDERVATMRGTARTTPARAHWTFEPDGPLGWLAGARQLGSLRLADFRMDFG